MVMTMVGSNSALLVVSNRDVDRHVTGEHPEQGPRTAAALDGLESAGLREAVHWLASRPASIEELRSVHTPEYIARLETFCAAGGGDLDADTPVCAGSWSTALHAAGGGIAAVEALDAGVANAGLVLARPPGHHARPGSGMGFCLFNNVAIAAAHLANRGERVVVLDWDVHHGNGTQEAFWNDDRVLFVSIHQYPYYPGSGRVNETGGPPARGCTINVPVPAGATGDVYLEAFDTLIAPASAEFAPTWVLVSAGFDAHRDDPLADVLLTSADFADLTRRVRTLAPRHGRLLLFLEGGYDLDALRNSVGASAAALCDVAFRPEPATNGGPGRDGVQKAIEAHRISTSW